MIEHLDKMEKAWYNERFAEKSDIPRSEMLRKQIDDYELFIKYLNIYINDIQIRLRRLNSMYDNALRNEEYKRKKTEGINENE